jgi:hypothetical protein
MSEIYIVNPLSKEPDARKEPEEKKEEPDEGGDALQLLRKPPLTPHPSNPLPPYVLLFGLPSALTENLCPHPH